MFCQPLLDATHGTFGGLVSLKVPRKVSVLAKLEQELGEVKLTVFFGEDIFIVLVEEGVEDLGRWRC